MPGHTRSERSQHVAEIGGEDDPPLVGGQLLLLQSHKVSGGHPYPLLNSLKLRVQVNGKLALSGSDKVALARAERFRDGQSQQTPPFDKPWCFFDLAEIKLYRGDRSAFLKIATLGFEHTEQDWQGKTFVESLRLLLPAADELPGLHEDIAQLEQMVL